jgi:hypothetical protein
MSREAERNMDLCSKPGATGTRPSRFFQASHRGIHRMCLAPAPIRAAPRVEHEHAHVASHG